MNIDAAVAQLLGGAEGARSMDPSKAHAVGEGAEALTAKPEFQNVLKLLQSIGSVASADVAEPNATAKTAPSDDKQAPDKDAPDNDAKGTTSPEPVFSNLLPLPLLDLAEFMPTRPPAASRQAVAETKPTSSPASAEQPTPRSAPAPAEATSQETPLDLVAAKKADTTTEQAVPKSDAPGKTSVETLPLPTANAAVTSSRDVASTSVAAPAPAAHRPTVELVSTLDKVPEVVGKGIQGSLGTHTVVVHVEPRDLGELRLWVRVENQQVYVQVAEGSEAARAVIAQGAHQLGTALQQQGLSFGGFESPASSSQHRDTQGEDDEARAPKAPKAQTPTRNRSWVAVV